MSVNMAELESRLADVNALMRAHAGGIEIVRVGEDGSVTVRFSGKCCGCDLKPLTLMATIRPGLLAVAGVTEVNAEGARISDEAAARIAAAVGGDSVRQQWLEQVHRRPRVAGADG